MSVAAKKKIDSNTELEDSSADFSALNYSGVSINKHDTNDESGWESDFLTDISENDPSIMTKYLFPLKYFCSIVVSKNMIIHPNELMQINLT